MTSAFANINILLIERVGKWFFVMSIIGISQIISKVEHLFICLSAICAAAALVSLANVASSCFTTFGPRRLCFLCALGSSACECPEGYLLLGHIPLNKQSLSPACVGGLEQGALGREGD